MTSSPWWRGAGGLVTALVAIATALPIGQADARVPTVTSPTVELAVTAISPTVLQPGDDLRVTVRLTNGGAEIAEPRLLVHLGGSFISRSSLDVWRTAGPYTDLGPTVTTEDLDDPLDAGQSRTVTLTVPAEDVGQSTIAWQWGARGLGLEVVDVADRTRLRLGVARTFVVWFPEQNVNPTRVSLLVPVTGPAPSETTPAELSALTAPGGRLAELLAATGEYPEVSWALDPWLIRAAQDTESVTDPAGPSTDPPEEQPPWSEAVGQAAVGREVALLPWGDADVTALVHAGATGLLESAWRRSSDAAQGLDLAASTDLLLPGEALPDLTTASQAAADGQALVVGPGEMPAPAVLTYTPSGKAVVTTARGDVTVLVPDPRLSEALSGGWVLPEAGSAQPTGATAAADLLAELAVITRERPADSRHVLLTVPRDWLPEVETVHAQLDALATAPWVETAPLTELEAEPGDAPRGTLPARVVEPGEVSATALDAVAAAIETRRALASVADDPSALLGDLEAERLAPAALAWRSDPQGRAALVAASSSRTRALREAVSVPPAETVLLVSTSGELPVRVANTLDQDVTVGVRLRPSNSRLVANETVEVVVPADGEATATIPVHGVQSADVETTVELLTSDGQVIDAATTLTVQVRAEWESIGTAVVGGLLALALVVGLIRTIRRGHGSGRLDAAEAAALEDAERGAVAAEGSTVAGTAAGTP